MLSPFRALYLASFLMLLFMRRHTSALVNPLCPSSLAGYRSIRALSATKEQGKGKQQNQQNQQKKGAGKAGKKEDDETRIVPRDEDYSAWYSSVIKHASLAQSSPTRGSMIIKPWGMSLWDRLRAPLDAAIKSSGAQNAYFPLLIPQSFLSKEAEHVDGFAKECAVVTHHRLASDGEGGLVPDPSSKLAEPLVIRPTSETIIWSTFKTWITSHRDLPLKINQWANVVRWEMRTRPFLRTSEFLWQEGHTAHATPSGALSDASQMIGVYSTFARDVLALPTVVGRKSDVERFAGAEETFTIEALMQNGWALQAGTSHYLGQSFGKAFDVTFQSDTGAVAPVYGSSWGVSTRMVGAVVMAHSDDDGLVLPPRVAEHQVVLVPIKAKKGEEEKQRALDSAVSQVVADLEKRGVRVHVDDRDWVRNGAKYFEWERKGVPCRIEVGPRDVEKGECVVKWRKSDFKEGKIGLALSDVGETLSEDMEAYHDFLLQAAQARLASSVSLDATYAEMSAALSAAEASIYPGPGLYLVPWKANSENEEKIKEECKATIRCYPLDVNEGRMWEGKKCFYSGEDATHMALFGRAF